MANEKEVFEDVVKQAKEYYAKEGSRKPCRENYSNFNGDCCALSACFLNTNDIGVSPKEREVKSFIISKYKIHESLIEIFMEGFDTIEDESNSYSYSNIRKEVYNIGRNFSKELGLIK